MTKRKHILLSIVIGIGIIYLAGCKSGSEANPVENVTLSDMDSAGSSMTETDTAVLAEESQGEAEEEPEQKEPENEEDEPLKEVPQLFDTGRRFEDFVPEGWKILDSVELDFNEDGMPDYVGVLEAALIDMEGYWTYQDCPRILFAIASDGTGGYCLDFQDINLIRTRNEGGVYGDPYQPLTAEGVSFATHTYGGSAWRWSGFPTMRDIWTIAMRTAYFTRFIPILI